MLRISQRGKPIHPGRDGDILPVYSYQEQNSNPQPISGFSAVQFNSGLNTIDPQPPPSSSYKLKGLGIVPKKQIE